MARTRLLLLGGALALLATSATVCLQVIAVVYLDKPTPRWALVGSASLELVVLLTLGWLAASHILQPGKIPSNRCLIVAFALETLACILAAAASAVALVLLAQSPPDDVAKEASAGYRTKLIVASSGAVALATALQLIFLVCHFVCSRRIALGRTSSKADGDSQRTPNFRVKSVRYSQTCPKGDQGQEMASVERKDTAASTTGAIGFFRASFSQAIRPSSSRTRLLSTRDRRPISLDSTPARTSGDDSFDSWDTSSVDAHNRQAVLEASSPPLKSRCLETIPASPATSRSPSPGTSDLEPPRSLRTSRSWSSTTLRPREEPRLTPSSSASELHIHPLFRSDSPTPPPAVSPGTTVVASPIAGQVITRRESMQSLSRIRSGSLPAGRSPLSRQTSLESATWKKQSEAQQAGEEHSAQGPQKTMIPPVPEWPLGPGQATPDA